MKAIIDVQTAAAAFASARKRLARSAGQRADADFHLSYESARSLFGELTPARMDLLRMLRDTGASSVRALAAALERNYANVHTDVARLLELGLVERDEAGMVFVPFDEIEIRLLQAPEELTA